MLWHHWWFCVNYCHIQVARIFYDSKMFIFFFISNAITSKTLEKGLVSLTSRFSWRGNIIYFALTFEKKISYGHICISDLYLYFLYDLLLNSSSVCFTTSEKSMCILERILDEAEKRAPTNVQWNVKTMKNCRWSNHCRRREEEWRQIAQQGRGRSEDCAEAVPQPL